MEFLFAKDEEFCPTQLGQGDLLIRTEEISSVLSEAHQYYAEAETYSHFIVVTQSCDLVRRGKKPKASYITIAAVRPASVLIDRYMAKLAFLWKGTENVGLYDIGKRELAQQFLERLLNNEEKGYFFLKAGSHPSVVHDLCAFLPLSIALKTDHYDALLKAKVAQLDSVFAAKLGWLVGNLYSRVATPDLEERGMQDVKEAFLAEQLGNAWVSGTRWKEVGKRLTQRLRADPQLAVSPENVRQELGQVPTDMELLAARAAEIARAAGLIPDDGVLAQLVTRLSNDATLKSIAKGVR